MAEHQLGFDFNAPTPGTPRAPWPVAPTATMRPAAPTALQDFGEKIGGARKDAPGQRSVLKPVANPQKFTDAWPLTPAGHALDADGLADRAYAWALREEARAMRPHYRNAEWLQHVTRLREYAHHERRIDSTDHAEDGAIVRASATSAVYEHVDERYWHSLRDVRVFDVKNPTIPRIALRIAGHPRNYMDVDDPKLAADVTALATAKAGKTITFGIYHRHGEAACWIAPTNLRGADRCVRLKEFGTVDDARAYLRDASKRPELIALADQWAAQHRVSRADVRNATNAERIGEDYRNGRDVTPERFMQDFGFRGVEFGNWVGQGKEATERQGQLNRTYDALRDLAAVTHMQPKDLSLNGALALSFGARGHGGKGAPLAHYEPDRNVIALTKVNGPGCLAHEWFHALDHYTAAASPDARWQANSTAFSDLHKAVRFSGMGQRSEALDKASSGGRYWSNAEELVARAFEAHVHQALGDAGQSDDFLVNLRVASDFAASKSGSVYPYPTADESRALAPAIESAVSSGRQAIYAARERAASMDRDDGMEIG
ncbi:MAG TPA: LPD5 domain-containing protein [Rhodanobacteraceae bacterium]